MHGKIVGDFRKKENSMSQCNVATKEKRNQMQTQTSVKTNTIHNQKLRYLQEG